MKAKFLRPNDPLLTKVAEKIPSAKFNSLEIKKIAELMIKIISREQKGRKKGVGLAAPQIGILKRIILVDVKANRKGKTDDLRVYINPEIIWKSKREAGWYEGCFSTGNICGIVSRPTSIKIQAFVLTPQGWSFEFVEEKWIGYVARIFQHEIDHLDGKVFVEHIKDPDKLHWVKESEFPIYRNKMAWKTWLKKCSESKWKMIKKGTN